MRLPLLPDELWWSGTVADGDDLPYGGFVFRRDLGADIGHNQANPVLLSNRGRYVWSERPPQIHVEDGVLTVLADTAPVVDAAAPPTLRAAFRAAMGAHCPPSGRAPGAALFRGAQFNTWIELGYDQRQERILEYAEGIVDHGYPAGVLMIDDNWQEDYGVWKFHPGRFRDPKALIDRLHELGLAVMLWTCPFVSPDSAVFRDLERRGRLLRDHTGATVIRRWWNGYSAVLDLTDDDTVEWYHDQLAALQRDLAVDGFKFDAGDPRFYAADDQAARPGHPNDQCEQWLRVGLRYPLNEFRAGWRQAGQALNHRLRDTVPTWGRGGLASLIPGGLAQGLAGYAFTCPDMIGGGLVEGFEQAGYALDEELIVRWAQCSALFPMMQFSLAPWRVLDAENAAHCRAAVAVRERFAERIAGLVEHAAATGEPIMRHLEYVFPGLGYERVTDQFLLGDDLLVAPVLVRGARTRTVTFPPGTWVGDDESVVVGPTTELVSVPLGRLPHYRLS